MGFNKKVLSKAVSELGKAKAPAKPRDIITDPAGQWKYPGQKTRIPGNDITMQGVDYPVWAQPNVGPGTLMQPGQDYNFPDADYVDETPLAKKGGTLKSKKYSKSMSATNKLFTKNKLFQNKKSKIFDPNAKFKSGGSKLGPINLNPNPLSHYELNYGFNLPTKQDGGDIDGEELELTDEEIQAYRDAGYEVDELPEAQNGKTVYSGPNLGLQGPTSFKTNGAPTIANAKILEKERKNTLPQKQQLIKPKIKIPSTVAEADRMIETGEIVPSKPSTPEEDYQTTKSMIDAVGIGFYPAAVVGSGLDALEGNYSSAAMGLIPFVGKAGKHGKLWGKVYTKGYNALAPKIGYANAHKILHPLKHLGKGISSGSSLGFQGVDTYNDNPFNVLDEKEIGGFVQHELVKAQKGKTVKPLEIADPKEFAYRDRAYNDSLDMYKNDLLATKYYDLANNPAYADDFFINAKKGSTYIEKMKKIKKNSPAKFGDVFAKQKKPVQPVILKQVGSNNTPVKSKHTESKKPLEISDPKEFARRKAAYNDSLKLHNKSIEDLKGMSNTKYIKAGKYSDKTPQAGWSQGYINSKKDDVGNTVKGKIKPTGINYSTRKSDGEDVVSFMYQKPIQPVTFKKGSEPINTIHNNTTEPISTLPLRPIEKFTSPEQTIIPSKPYVKPKQYSGPRYGTLAGDENLDLPEGYTQQEKEAARRQRDADEFQRKNLEYQQQRLSKPITKAQKGLTKKPLIISDPKEFAYRNKMYADSLSLYNNSEKLKKPYYKKLADVKKDKSNLFMGVSTAYQTKANNYKVNQYNKNGKIDQTSTGPGHFSTDYIGGSETDPDDWTKEVKKNHKTIRPVSANSFSYADKDFHLYNPYLLNYKKPVQPIQFQKEEPVQSENTQGVYTVDTLPFLPTTTIQSLNPEFIPQRTVQPKSYSNPNRHGVWSDKQLPRILSPENWLNKTREYQQQQRGNKTVAQVRKEGGDVDSWEDELSDEEIEELRKAGYIIEELD